VRIGLVLASGLALLAVAAIVTLSHAPLSLAATNEVPDETVLATTVLDTGACQGHEALPAGTTAIRLDLEVTTGPRVLFEALSGGRVITRGARAGGWNGAAVTIPVTPVRGAFSDVTVCFHVTDVIGRVGLIGAATSPALAATDGRYALPGRMGVEYLRPGNRSWWSMAGAIIRHMGLGRAGGSWVVLLIAALAAAIVACSSWTALRELR
jgi:hypothetical protein